MSDGSHTTATVPPSPSCTSTTTAPPTLLSALIGLALAFGWLPLLYLIPGFSSRQLTNVHDDIVNVLTKWTVVILLSIIAFSVQRRKVSEFGIRGLSWRDVLAALAGLFAAFIMSGAATRIVAIPSSVTDVEKLAAVPLALRVALVLSAAVCEEFIFRGFAIEELTFLTRKRWLAGLIALMFFTFGHAGIYGVSLVLIVPGIVGAVLTALYLWRRNLPGCVLVHAVMDGIFLIVVPAVSV